MSRRTATENRVAAALKGEEIKKDRRRGTVRRVNTLSEKDIADTLHWIRNYSLQPLRDALYVLLTCRLGLRACEVAGLHAEDVLDARGKLKDSYFVSARCAKNGKERDIPLSVHADLVEALTRYFDRFPIKKGPVFINQFGRPLVDGDSPLAIKRGRGAVQKHLTMLYTSAGLEGCASHSGRRTFGTRLARALGKTPGSLRDVQKLMGHADLKTTEAYIDFTPHQADLAALVGANWS